MSAADRIQEAFDRLNRQNGFESRPHQIQLALLISDMIESGATGVFEAPTGLGKSFAALLPAIANALESGKRTVVATYTNVLAEQYWRKDLPFALSLFDDSPKIAFMIGRQRYACLVQLEDELPSHREAFQEYANLGIESEFRRFAFSRKDLEARVWPKIATPSVCPARACPMYDDCYYYQARKRAEDAQVIITNHAFLLQDAIVANVDEEGEGLLGKVDFAIIDEAHDLPGAAVNALEFEITSSKLAMLSAMSIRLEKTLSNYLNRTGLQAELQSTGERFRTLVDGCQSQLASLGRQVRDSKLVAASPGEILDHPALKALLVQDERIAIESLAVSVRDACQAVTKRYDDILARLRDEKPESHRMAYESAQMTLSFLREYGSYSGHLLEPQGASISHVGQFQGMYREGQGAVYEPRVRSDVVDVAEPLKEILWNRVPTASLSATLAVDGAFDHYKRTTGVDPMFEEILPSPYDFRIQAALYLPKAGRIPDPTLARQNKEEPTYHYAIAQELRVILEACEGRTLVLFHSRKEMEAVRGMLDMGPDYPILVQPRSGAGDLGERFRKDPRTSLFALRSFWTGFDAPGETLICTVLVRIPFEVPTEPAQLGRLAYLAKQELDPFQVHTLPNAKMMMRQGAGRLIRSTRDWGVVAVLDPRVRTKRYGETILENLPTDMRRFDDFWEALAHVKAENGVE